jgi:hypothetical protein
MSRARSATHVFTDSKVALRDAITRPSKRLSSWEGVDAIGSRQRETREAALSLVSAPAGHLPGIRQESISTVTNPLPEVNGVVFASALLGAVEGREKPKRRRGNRYVIKNLI